MRSSKGPSLKNEKGRRLQLGHRRGDKQPPGGAREHRARRAERATRALSVAMPVFAYICRYSFEISTNARRARMERTHVERCQTAGSE